MTANIFPGLSEPKSKLYFDLQAMIAKEGGRLRLAEKIEAEQSHIFNRNRKRGNNLDVVLYTQQEINFIKANYDILTCNEIALELGRKYNGIKDKIWQLQRNGELHSKKANLRFAKKRS